MYSKNPIVLGVIGILLISLYLFIPSNMGSVVYNSSGANNSNAIEPPKEASTSISNEPNTVTSTNVEGGESREASISTPTTYNNSSDIYYGPGLTGDDYIPDPTDGHKVS